jgi:hypothetical protein
MNRATATAVAFGATMFASSALNNIFVTYYIVYFTQVVRLSVSSFFFGQLIFMCVPRITSASKQPLVATPF